MSNKNSPPANVELATFAGGCFWCLEAVFKQLRGVQQVVSGYSGGHVEHPSYRQVCGGETGHAEVVQITFDPQLISYEDLLEVFFQTHDPTTLNRQGNDVGTQYRSTIFTHSPGQQEQAQAAIGRLNESGVYPSRIVTEVLPLKNFFAAEDYHQDYFALNGSQPYCQLVVRPKVEKFRQAFRGWLK